MRIIIFLTFMISIVNSFLPFNKKYVRHLSKLYLKYEPKKIWEEMDMFDKFEYYSAKNDTQKQHEYMLKIHKLISTKIKLRNNKEL